MNPGDRVRATQAYADRLRLCGVDEGYIAALQAGGTVTAVAAGNLIAWTLDAAPVFADESVGICDQGDVASDLELMPAESLPEDLAATEAPKKAKKSKAVKP
jgi:hypothetical protein